MNRLSCLMPVIITAVTAISAFAQNPLLGPPGAPPTGPATIPGEAVVTPAKPPEPDFPKPEEALKGYEKVVSTADGRKSFYNVWSRGKDQQLLAELPAAYASQRHYLFLTVASGDAYAGLQAGEVYFYWKNYGKRLHGDSQRGHPLHRRQGLAGFHQAPLHRPRDAGYPHRYSDSAGRSGDRLG